MEGVRTPMSDSLQRWLRAGSAIASLGAASYVLFTGLGVFIVLPRDAEATLSTRLAPALWVLVAGILNLDIAWILCGSHLRKFIAAFLGSLVLSMLGAFLLSLLLFRGHWLDLVVK
jgi:hypothetical protein